MQKNIAVAFSVNDQDVLVDVSYKIEQNENLQVISCTISAGKYINPTWLQLHKFEFRSYLQDGIYVPLFNDNSNIKNINTALFVDKTFVDIMAKESFTVALN